MACGREDRQWVRHRERESVCVSVCACVCVCVCACVRACVRSAMCTPACQCAAPPPLSLPQHVMGSLVGIWAWGAWCAFFALHLLLLFLWRRTRLGVTLQSTLSRGGSTDEGPEPWGDDCLDSLQLNQFTLRFKSKAVERNYLDLHTRGNMTLAVFVFSYSVPMAAMVAVGFFDDYSQLSHLVISALIAVCAAAYVILTSYQVRGRSQSQRRTRTSNGIIMVCDCKGVGENVPPPPPLSKQRLCPSNTRHWFRQFLHR